MGRVHFQKPEYITKVENEITNTKITKNIVEENIELMQRHQQLNSPENKKIISLKFCKTLLNTARPKVDNYIAIIVAITSF